MALVDGGAGTLCYALDCLRLALAASFVVLLGKIGIIAVTKGNPAEISTAASSEDQEEGGIIRVVVRVSSVHYDSVIACSFVISGSYLLQIVLQGERMHSYTFVNDCSSFRALLIVATRIVQVDLPLALYALTGLATFSLVRWTQGIDRATRGRRFLSILRTTCAIVAIFEVAIVAVLFRLVVGSTSRVFLRSNLRTD